MKRIVSIMLMLFLFCAVFQAKAQMSRPLASVCGDKEKAFLTELDLSSITALVFEDAGVAYHAYVITDAEVIGRVCAALQSMTLGETTDLRASDADTGYTFILQDGSTCSFNFNMKNYEHGGECYIISESSDLWKLTGKLEEGESISYPFRDCEWAKDEQKVEKIVYDRLHTSGETFEITDDQDVQSIVRCLAWLDVECELDIYCTDYDDVITLVMKDGTTETICFNAHHLEMNKTCWFSGSSSQLFKLLDKAIAEK